MYGEVFVRSRTKESVGTKGIAETIQYLVLRKPAFDGGYSRRKGGEIQGTHG